MSSVGHSQDYSDNDELTFACTWAPVVNNCKEAKVKETKKLKINKVTLQNLGEPTRDLEAIIITLACPPEQPPE